IATAVGAVVGAGLGKLLLGLARRIARRTALPWNEDVVSALSAALKVLWSILAGYLLAELLELPTPAEEHFGKLVRAALILTLVWGTIRALYAYADAIANVEVKDTLDPERLAMARGRRTQVLLATRVLSVLVSIIGLALTALQFEVVRSVGLSLLASAGVASVAIGFAAQRSLGALLAGIQLSISQPIRMGDFVVFRGEMGTIEDIGLTYVAIRLWDERRLLVPTTRLLEEPIENWSRSRTGLTGVVLLAVHPSLELGLLRDTLKGILESEPLWDGRLREVYLSDITERAATARVVISASHPSALFDLRYRVRERLVRFLCDHRDGRYLPETRLRNVVEMAGEDRVGVRDPAIG
ncbi:MAG: hypothetical protein RL385_796, partial [Pseudomonadota bacterium]